MSRTQVWLRRDRIGRFYEAYCINTVECEVDPTILLCHSMSRTQVWLRRDRIGRSYEAYCINTVECEVDHKPTSLMNKRLHIYYSGSVQGVGFRYMARGAASPLGVTGWVKNLEDGRVEVVCEGQEASIDKFLDRIKDIFGEYVRDARMEPEKATGEFEGFDIRF